MTQDQFNSLFTAGDKNAAWAAVENHIAGEVSVMETRLNADIAQKDRELQNTTQKLSESTSALENTTRELRKFTDVTPLSGLTGSTLQFKTEVVSGE